MKLDRDDMMEAVAEGVRQALVEIARDRERFDAPHELLYNAIRQGTKDAIWAVATNATDMPCSDFYQTIKEGVSEAMQQLRDE